MDAPLCPIGFMHSWGKEKGKPMSANRVIDDVLEETTPLEIYNGNVNYVQLSIDGIREVLSGP
jgi:hypothetical protein